MTIEEKVRAYDNIIEKANKMHCENCEACQMCIEELIPELKESKDERIRKNIISWLKNIGGQTIPINDYNSAIAWLENQGEQKTTKIEVNAGELSDFERSLKHIIEEAIECGDTHNLKADADMLLRIAHKSAWSEEDENMLKMVINSCEQCGNEYAYSWLKSLKDRVQPKPKQEWSEEDNQYLCGLIGLIEQSKAELPITLKGKAADNCINWLKSLGPQNRWKPSDEQMKAFWETYKGGEEQAALASLYSDLKKLRGE